MNVPRVSVLIPTFNGAKFLGDAIASVLAQTFRDFELLVVDDGSTDETAALVRGVGDGRVIYVEREHAGLSASLNAGLRLARGEYVARNDADDVWHPHLLATLVAALDARPHVGVVYARCDGIYADGSPSRSTRGGPLRYPDDALRSLLYADYSAVVATVARRNCYERVGGWRSEFDLTEDWEVMLRLARYFPVEYVDCVVASVREHAANSTAIGGPTFERRLRLRLEVLDAFFAAPDLDPSVRALAPIAYRNAHVGVGLQWLMVRDVRRAFRHFGLATRAGAGRARAGGRILWCVALWFGINRCGPLARGVARASARWRTRRGAGGKRAAAHVPHEATPNAEGATSEARSSSASRS